MYQWQRNEARLSSLATKLLPPRSITSCWWSSPSMVNWNWRAVFSRPGFQSGTRIVNLTSASASTILARRDVAQPIVGEQHAQVFVVPRAGSYLWRWLGARTTVAGGRLLGLLIITCDLEHARVCCQNLRAIGSGSILTLFHQERSLPSR